jgi:hypothetical protein
MARNLIVPCIDVVANEQCGGHGKSLNGLDGFQVVVSVNDVGSSRKAVEVGFNRDSQGRNFISDLPRRPSINHGLVTFGFHGPCEICD